MKSLPLILMQDTTILKKEFYNKCTESFTKEWIEKIKILKVWIIQKL